MFKFIKEGDTISIDELVKGVIAVDRQILVLRTFEGVYLEGPQRLQRRATGLSPIITGLLTR